MPSAIPAQEGDLCLLVTFLARTLKCDTIRNYLFGLRSFHIENGFADPTIDKLLLQKMLRGVRRIQGEADKKPKFPVTLALLELVEPLIDWSSHDHVMLYAAWCTACGGLLRASEFTVASSSSTPLLRNSSVSPVKIDGGYVFRGLELGESKADPFRRGVTIVLGHSASRANALNVLAAYDRLRSDTARSPSAPLFAFKDGTVLSKESCIRHLRSALSMLKMDVSRFHGFSFHRGGAQSLRDAGVPDHLIRDRPLALGRVQGVPDYCAAAHCSAGPAGGHVHQAARLHRRANLEPASLISLSFLSNLSLGAREISLWCLHTCKHPAPPKVSVPIRMLGERAG